MKSKLTENLGLKIISLLASILLWAIVTTISDPAVSTTFYNVPVELLNTDVITDSGRVYHVIDDTDVIPRVTVRAARSVISELSAADIVATADISDLSSLDTISIRLDTKSYQEQILSISGSIDTVKLSIENQKTKTLALTTEISGDPAEGYVIGSATPDQNLVKITGAESLVDSVSKAVAEIDVSGFSQNIETAADIYLYDADDKEIKDEDLEVNMTKVQVSVSILETKTVPVIFNVSGEPADGYIDTGDILSDKDTAYICGSTSAISDIEELQVDAEAISIDGEKDDVTATIDIRDYLPAGVRLVNEDDAVYEVTVKIEPESSKHISISTDDITVTGVPDGYSATVAVDEGTTVDLTGLSSQINSLNKNSISPTVNVESYFESSGKEIAEGFYTVNVTFELPSSVRSTKTIEAVLHVVKKD